MQVVIFLHSWQLIETIFCLTCIHAHTMPGIRGQGSKLSRHNYMNISKTWSEQRRPPLFWYVLLTLWLRKIEIQWTWTREITFPSPGALLYFLNVCKNSSVLVTIWSSNTKHIPYLGILWQSFHLSSKRSVSHQIRLTLIDESQSITFKFHGMKNFLCWDHKFENF